MLKEYRVAPCPRFSLFQFVGWKEIQRRKSRTLDESLIHNFVQSLHG